MATKKSKQSNKSTKTKATKTAEKTTVKTTVKTTEAAEHEAPKKEVVSSSKNKSCLSGFFAKKYEPPAALTAGTR